MTMLPPCYPGDPDADLLPRERNSLKIRSESEVRTVAPAASRREYPVADLPGLYLLVTPAGARSWVVRYRQGGCSRKLTLGDACAIGLQDARKTARKLLGEVAGGGDPAARRRQQRRKPALSFPAIVEQFVDLHARKNRSWKEQRRLLLVNAVPAFGSTDVGTITRKGVIEALEQIEKERGPVVASSTYRVLRKMFNWLVEREVVPASPCLGISAQRWRITSRSRVLSDSELAAVLNAADLDGYPGGWIVRLLALTGARREEVGGMRWDELDLTGGLWTLPGARTKNGVPHKIPLVPELVSLLRRIPRAAGQELVFSVSGEARYSSYSKLMKRLVARSGVRDWRIHDLRRTCASGMARLGVQPYVIARVLNHRSGPVGGVHAIYNRYSYDSEALDALNRWASHVRAIAASAR